MKILIQYFITRRNRDQLPSLSTFTTYVSTALACTLVVVSAFMFHELQHLRVEANRLRQMREAYEFYMHQAVIFNQYDFDADEIDDDQVFDEDDEFVVLNRDPDYLKATVLSQWRPDLEEPQRTKKKPIPASKPPTRFSWPLEKGTYWISSYYGRRGKKLHAGIDLAAHRGTPIKASHDGKVEFADGAGTFGNMILLSHDRTFKTRYAHLNKILVAEGETVKKGQLIGHVGNTGRVSGKNGHHLHFEVLEFDQAVNPLKHLV